jgi:hypothetical protein
MRHYKNVPHSITIIQLRKSPPPLRPTMSFRATLPPQNRGRTSAFSRVLNPHSTPGVSTSDALPYNRYLYKRKTFTTTMKRIHRQHTLVFTHENNLVQSNVSPKRILSLQSVVGCSRRTGTRETLGFAEREGELGARQGRTGANWRWR